jgi:hypothetical protein
MVSGTIWEVVEAPPISKSMSTDVDDRLISIRKISLEVTVTSKYDTLNISSR